MSERTAFGVPELTPGSHIWLTHRLQRDALLEQTAAHGGKGWLNPPIHFLSELPTLFGIRTKPIGQLQRRERVGRLADAAAVQFGMPLRSSESPASGHILDAFFGELVPEGVKPQALEAALATLDADDFARRRAAWLVSTYTTYLTELERDQLYDPRQIHALIADRIDAGELPNAINGAKLLHIYALYTARSRRRLLEALARQHDVEVIVHTRGDTEDVRALITCSADARADEYAKPVVQPAPDGARELQWIAGEVKKLLLSGEAEPHEIAVVARTGLHDTRRALRVLEDCIDTHGALPRLAEATHPDAIGKLFPHAKGQCIH